MTENVSKQANEVADYLQSMFPRNVTFALLLADVGTDGNVNWISNGDRADMICMMKEMIARFEWQPDIKGTA